MKKIKIKRFNEDVDNEPRKNFDACLEAAEKCLEACDECMNESDDEKVQNMCEEGIQVVTLYIYACENDSENYDAIADMTLSVLGKLAEKSESCAEECKKLIEEIEICKEED